MGTLSILFIIKIVINSEIFLTQNQNTGFLSKMRPRNQILMVKKQIFINEIVSVFQVMI